MALSSQPSMVVFFIFGVCIFQTFIKVDGHVLVYRRLTNQLIEEYNDMPAQFGPSLPTNGIKVFAMHAQPDEACDKIKPPFRLHYPDYAKFVAIIQRGGREGCTFELKVRNAQAAGYDAAVIYNNEGDDLEHMSAQNASGILIPSVFVGHTAGTNLISFVTSEIVLVINDELPFNINTQLILPFSILIGLCFLIMIIYMIYKCIREERRLRRYRLPKGMLKKLPIIKFTKNSELAYDTCVICLDEFAEGDKLRVLPCKHPYHTSCIDVWLTQNKRDCPICKRKVFMKGETRSQRNRQSSLDSVTDTDDDTTPLLQQQQSPTRNSSINSTDTTTATSTGSHGTFHSSRSSNIEAGAIGDVASSDDEMLSPTRRINPFDRSPNLPPHLASLLNNEPRTGSIWHWPVLRWFRQPVAIGVAAPPYLEDTLNDIFPVQSSSSIASAIRGRSSSAANDSNTINSSRRASHSSNNVLNPNLSGSFKDDENDAGSLQCMIESIIAQTAANSGITEAPTTDTTAENVNNINETDSVFIQTPTQGGIAVAALPPNNNNNNNNVNSSLITFW